MSRVAIRPLNVAASTSAPRTARFPLLSQRFASTSTTPSSPPPATSARPVVELPRQLPMKWDQYFALRKQRRLWSTLLTVPATAAGLFAGGSYFGQLESDPTQLIMGIEPMYIYAGATMGCAMLGYLLGPTAGSAIFSLAHSSVTRGNPAPLQVMDRALHGRIVKLRASPDVGNLNNPVPDYYGEKIVSLKTYRRWIRDQAAYKRKALHGVPTELQ